MPFLVLLFTPATKALSSTIQLNTVLPRGGVVVDEGAAAATCCEAGRGRVARMRPAELGVCEDDM